MPSGKSGAERALASYVCIQWRSHASPERMLSKKPSSLAQHGRPFGLLGSRLSMSARLKRDAGSSIGPASCCATLIACTSSASAGAPLPTVAVAAAVAAVAAAAAAAAVAAVTAVAAVAAVAAVVAVAAVTAVAAAVAVATGAVERRGRPAGRWLGGRPHASPRRRGRWRTHRTSRS